MSWKSAANLASNNHTRRGVQREIIAGMVCRQAEIIAPELFRAVSYKNGILTVEVTPENAMACKLKEGTLITDLRSYCTQIGTTLPSRIRLTIVDS